MNTRADDRRPWIRLRSPPQRRHHDLTSTLPGPKTRPRADLQATSPAVSGASIVRMRPPKYWLYHQIGANNMHQRQVLPFGASNWDPPIQGAIEKVVLDYFDDGDP